MKKTILGIDIGTTSLKTAVFTAKGERLATATVEYQLLTPKTGYVEAPCGIYLESIKKCLILLRDREKINTRDIVFISFSVQGETMCFLDSEAKPLGNAIVWMDNRAGRQAAAMTAHFTNEHCYKITGQTSFEANWPAAKIQWFKEKQSDAFRRVRHILLLEDYIIYQLTGYFFTEGSLLTSSLYWDITTKKYWPEMLEYLGINEEILPEIKEPGEPVGTILPAMAKELQVSPDAEICMGCLDQAAAAIGVGNIKPGIFSENIGAALAVCVPTKGRTYDPNRLMPIHYFSIPDTYMMHTFTTGGMCLRWFRDTFCTSEITVSGLTGDDSYHLMDKEAESVPPGSDGLICLPHLQGSLAPDVNLDAKAVFYGMTLKHNKNHFIRSIMESIGYIICRNLDAIGKMGLRIDEIRSMGGGSKSPIWNQMKADITGKTLSCTDLSQDVACLGAAILAGVAGGIFTSIESACGAMIKVTQVYKPDMDKHNIYKKHYERYQALFKAVSSVYVIDGKN